MQARWKTLAVGALVPALVTGGLAIAASDDGSGDRQPGDAARDRAGERHLHRFGPRGHGPMRNLTNGELHVRRNGKDVVVRLDRGKVTSASSDELKIKENDGKTVTVPVSRDTKVLAGPDRRGQKVSDLKVGQKVQTVREDGGAAKVVALRPRRDGRPPRGPMGRPPRGPMGGPPPGPPPFGDDQG